MHKPGHRKQRAERSHRQALQWRIALFLLAGCAQEEYPLALYDLQHPGPPDAQVPDSSVGSTSPAGRCVQAHATNLPARLVAMSSAAAAAPTTVLVSDVFQSFLSVCGECHGPSAANGGFQITTALAFKSGFTQTELNHVLSNGPSNPSVPMSPTDPNDPMPPFDSPNGEAFSKREETDPVKVFGELAQEWIHAGSPNDFIPPQASVEGDAGADGGAEPSQFLLRPAIGNAMTNIGDCIPDKGLVGSEETMSAQLDAKFAALMPQVSGTAAQVIGLPEHLSETDLFTLDSRTLAEYGVIAYAPGYPLWSDNAGKLRYVRVPRGTSIGFDKATQKFSIPANTRFYKTFMKQIVDVDGSIRWKKIETRLIVSRPDTAGLEGDAAPTAIYGTYRWNDAETDAVLVETPLRDGLPWSDTVLQYNTDEPLAARILATNPAAPDEALVEGQAARHYAIPSHERCLECHEGSQGQNFVLGFIPLQIARRPTGVGGVIEETGPDELTQLRRFIDYGVITGMDSPSDALPLEQSQGTRAPRNGFELIAQGYMLGNCSHCHNPRGDPSIENPALKPVLDFLPGVTEGVDGGIFQFPLEKYSPRIFRGQSGAVQIPYVTPSLVDQPRFDASGNFVVSQFLQNGQTNPPLGEVVYAPWRSLIYRNVDTAFSYTDDEALFPHMPRNTPGYDPRAHQILSDWMVSIPAELKHPELNEYAFVTSDGSFINGPLDESEQPYAEVHPGDPRYDAAVAAAKARLDVLHGVEAEPPIPPSPDVAAPPVRYDNLGETGDVIDPATLRDPVCSPVPTGQLCGPGTNSIQCDPPNHPDWVVLDTTSPPGPYTPRRTDWVDKLVLQHADSISGCGGGMSTANLAAHQDEENAVAFLQQVSLSQLVTAGTTFRAWGTTPIPYGFWQQAPGCDFSSAPTVAQITAGPNPPRWLTQAQNVAPTAPVYSQTPGAAVFKAICINCHGALADSTGRLAANLIEMTGGLARPADFRDGLFGPVRAMPDTNNRHLVFGSTGLPTNLPDWTDASLTDDDRASRYMAWMALGGTQVLIPQPILQIVALTRVLGERRPYLPAATVSANMLSTAKTICQTFLGPITDKRGFDPTQGGYGDIDQNKVLIHDNGDAETWFKLCHYGHRAPVHVIQFSGQLFLEPVYDGAGNLNLPSAQDGVLIEPTSYPPGVPVGNITGGTDPNLAEDNMWPWCIRPTPGVPAGLPLCPTGPNITFWQTDDGSKWAVRGAINAGLAVFLYVSQLESMSAPPPDYDECEQLAPARTP